MMKECGIGYGYDSVMMKEAEFGVGKGMGKRFGEFNVGVTCVLPFGTVIVRGIKYGVRQRRLFHRILCALEIRGLGCIGFMGRKYFSKGTTIVCFIITHINYVIY